MKPNFLWVLGIKILSNPTNHFLSLNYSIVITLPPGLTIIFCSHKPSEAI
jgi:hypothetical protein